MTADVSIATLRGCAVGSFTAALATAAHSIGGAAPTGGSAALLAVLACVTGLFAATTIRSGNLAALLPILGAGQLLGHFALATGHSHTAALPAVPMLITHTAAVAVGALLIQLCEQLVAVLNSVLRSAQRSPVVVTANRGLRRVRPVHQMRRAQLLAASISHRGPPVGAAR